MGRQRSIAVLAALTSALMLLLPAAALAGAVAVTDPATSITASSAVLAGTANPTSPDSTAQFQYGLTTAYGSYTDAQPIGSGTQDVSAPVAHLLPGTTYHFRLIVVQNSYEGTFSAGRDLTFTTTGNAAPPPSLAGSGPTISGRASEGATLRESHAAWSNHPSSYAYQWEDCDSSGAACAAIAGATGQTYTLGASDVGETIRVTEVASNAGGDSAPAVSDATATVLPLAPSATAPAPSISGDVTAGQTLVESHGGWSSPPTAYQYQWEDCDSSGAGCAGIAGATGQTYTLGSGDVGHTVRVLEVAFDAGGASAPAVSASTGIVESTAAPATPPVDSLVPVITGTPVVGRSLTASTGTWSGTPPLSYAFSWERCTPDCAAIPNATASTYTQTAADLGASLRVVVTASNPIGQGVSASGEVGPVLAAGPSRDAILAALKSLLPRALRRGRVLRLDGHHFHFTAPTAGHVTLVWTVRLHGHQVTIGSARVAFHTARRAAVVLTLTARGRALLEQRSLPTVHARARFTPAASGSVSRARRLRL